MRTCGTSRGEESICFCDRSPFFGCEVELEVSCGFEKADQINLLYFIRIGNRAYYPCSVTPALLHNDRYGWVTPHAWSDFRTVKEIHYSFTRRRVRVKSTIKIQSSSGLLA